MWKANNEAVYAGSGHHHTTARRAEAATARVADIEARIADIHTNAANVKQRLEALEAKAGNLTEYAHPSPAAVRLDDLDRHQLSHLDELLNAVHPSPSCCTNAALIFNPRKLSSWRATFSGLSFDGPRPVVIRNARPAGPSVAVIPNVPCGHLSLRGTYDSFTLCSGERTPSSTFGRRSAAGLEGIGSALSPSSRAATSDRSPLPARS